MRAGRLRTLVGGALGGLAVSLLATVPAAAATGDVVPAVKHVWIIQLENKSFDQSFVQNSNTYLWRDLPRQGALLRQYYGTGHLSLDNYIAQLSGQAPNNQTQLDCQRLVDVRTGTVTPTTVTPALGGGQSNGIGCVYPAQVPTLVDQLEAAAPTADAKALAWKGYMGDMGRDPAREQVTCGRPLAGGVPADPTALLGTADGTQSAAAGDQYAARHNPFTYFHSVIDDQARCSAHVVPLEPTAGGPTGGLAQDLQSASTTPAFSYITPNLCDDAHDATCVGTNLAGTHQGGLFAADLFLQKWVPIITGSPAFADGGMLVVTFDEGDVAGAIDSGTSDVPTLAAQTATSCCQQPAKAVTPLNGPLPNGIAGNGGGQVGAVVLSPYVTPGTVTDVGYNHYALLRTIEDLLGVTTGGSDGLGHLGYAGLPTGERAATTTATALTSAFVPFGCDVFSAAAGCGAATPGAVVPESRWAIGLPLLALAAGAGGVVALRRRRAVAS